MPRDVETLLPPRAAPARRLADIGGAGDAALLALLGGFVAIDAALVILWALL